MKLRVISLALLVLVAFCVQISVPAAQQSAHADPKSVFMDARRALAHGDYAAAKRGFTEVLKMDPRSECARNRLEFGARILPEA